MGDRVAALRGGELQQRGTAARALRHAREPVRRRLHRRADHEFSARRRSRREEGRGRRRRPVPAAAAAGSGSPRRRGFRPYAGREVMLGVRPEALQPGGDDGAGALAGVIAFVEDFGATQLVHLDVELAGNLREIATEPDEVALSRPRLRALDRRRSTCPRRRAPRAERSRPNASISSTSRAKCHLH